MSYLEALSIHPPHLKHIDLIANKDDQTRLTNESLQLLEVFQDLTSLSLGGRLIGYSFEALTKLIVKLAKLKKFQGVANDDVLMAIASNCPDLTHLKVSELNWKPISDPFFKHLAKKCPNIRSIKLDNLSKITDKTLFALGSNCKNLASVKLFECDHISNKGIIDLTEECKELKSLTFDDLSEIDDEAMQAIAKNCHHLESIRIIDCGNISDEGVIYLIEHSKKLKRIWGDFSDATVHAMNTISVDIRSLGASGISDDSMIPFAENHRKVTHLYLSNPRITDKTLFALATSCHELVVAYLEGTSITEKGIVALIENCPRLRRCFIKCNRQFQSVLKTKYPHIIFDNQF